MFNGLEFSVGLHEAPGHFAKQVRLGDIRAIRLFIKRTVAIQVPNQVVARLDHKLT